MKDNTTTLDAKKPELNETEKRANMPVYIPVAKIFDEEDSVLLMLQIPGADEASTDLSIENGILKIRANVVQDDLSGYQAIVREYGIRDYEQSFRLGRNIDTSNIDASYENGVLSIRLGKVKKTQAKKLSIRANK